MTVPRPLSLVVDKSRQILLSALEALRGTETPDGNVYVLHNGGGPLSARLAGGTPIAAYVPPEPATIEHQNLSTTNEEKLIMPGTGTDPKTYTTINEVRFAPNGNHLIIRATAADSSVVEFTVQVVGWPKPVS